MKAEHGEKSQEAQTSLKKWLLIGVVSRQQGNSAVRSVPSVISMVFMCWCHQACRRERADLIKRQLIS